VRVIDVVRDKVWLLSHSVQCILSRLVSAMCHFMLSGMIVHFLLVVDSVDVPEVVSY